MSFFAVLLTDEVDTSQETFDQQKEKGNAFFNEKKYTEAVECYTACIAASPQSAVGYSNRAMALLLQEKWFVRLSAPLTCNCSRYTICTPWQGRGGE